MLAGAEHLPAVKVDSGNEEYARSTAIGMKFVGGNILTHCILRDDHEFLSKYVFAYTNAPR